MMTAKKIHLICPKTNWQKRQQNKHINVLLHIRMHATILLQPTCATTTPYKCQWTLLLLLLIWLSFLFCLFVFISISWILISCFVLLNFSFDIFRRGVNQYWTIRFSTNIIKMTFSTDLPTCICCTFNILGSKFSRNLSTEQRFYRQKSVYYIQICQSKAYILFWYCWANLLLLLFAMVFGVCIEIVATNNNSKRISAITKKDTLVYNLRRLLRLSLLLCGVNWLLLILLFLCFGFTFYHKFTLLHANEFLIHFIE